MPVLATATYGYLWLSDQGRRTSEGAALAQQTEIEAVSGERVGGGLAAGLLHDLVSDRNN